MRPLAVDAASLAKVSEAFSLEESLGEDCAVCLCGMDAGQSVQRLKCAGKHVFHARCISEWLSTRSRCCPIDQEDLHKQICP